MTDAPHFPPVSDDRSSRARRRRRGAQVGARPAARCARRGRPAGRARRVYHESRRPGRAAAHRRRGAPRRRHPPPARRLSAGRASGRDDGRCRAVVARAADRGRPGERAAAWGADGAARAARRDMAAGARARRLPRLGPRGFCGDRAGRLGRGLDHASHGAIARRRAQVRRPALSAGPRGARRIAPRRARGHRGRPRVERRVGRGATGSGVPGRSALAGRSRVGTALVLGCPVPVGGTHRMGRRLLVAIDPSGAGYNAGDILCFADGRRIAHVALWAGAGHIVHSALARGGVASDDLFADTPAAERLRGMLVAVRRPETS